MGSCALDAEAVLLDIGVLQAGIDGADASLQAGIVRGAGADVVEVGEVELHVLQEGLDVDLAEGDVAFGAVVEDSVAAADRGLVVGSIGEADAWTEGAVHLVEAARCTSGNQRVGRGVDVGNAHGLIGGDTVAGPDQAVVRIARAGNHLARRRDGDGVGRVVDRGVEVGHVIALRVHGRE